MFFFFTFLLASLSLAQSEIKDGDLVKTEEGETIYLIQGKNKRLFPNLAVYQSFSYQDFSQVKVVTRTQLENYSEREPMVFKDGTLLRKEDEPTVFYVEEGKLKRIKSAKIYQTLFNDPNWQKLIWLPDDFFVKFPYPEGGEVNSPGEIEKVSPSEISPELRIFNLSGDLEKSFLVFEKDFKGGMNLGAIDLEKDGEDEILVVAGFGSKPVVKVFRQDGSLIIDEFLVFEEKFRGGANVASGDIDADGKEEIIAGAFFYGGPQIRIFDRERKLEASFFADDENLRQGVRVAAADLNNDFKVEIICGLEKEKKFVVKIFGLKEDLRPYLIKEFLAFEKIEAGEVSLAVGDLNGDGKKEIIVGAGSSQEPEVRVFDEKGNLLSKFLAYEKNFKGGVKVAAADLDGDSKEEIITAAGFSGGPHLKIFDMRGNPKINSFFAFGKAFRGGINLVVLNSSSGKKIAVMPRLTQVKGKDFYKAIEIDLSLQKLYTYQNGFLIEEEKISSGRRSMPTPKGYFKILRKNLVEYSKKYNLYMPHWQQFTYSGAGVHGLPYWQYGEKRVYEGVGHLGISVSHGCVRLSLEAAKRIYDWTEIGDEVIVH